MDPILEQKTKELYAKLTKARAAGVEITPDDIDQWMRRETKGKYGLSDAQGYVQSLSGHSVRNIAGALGHGASMEFQDELIGMAGGDEAKAADRLRDKAYSGRHPFASGGLKLIGALTGPVVAALAAPEATSGTMVGGAATLARSAVLGAGVGATTALGASEHDQPGDLAWDAAKGGAAGAVLGMGGTVAGRIASGVAGGLKTALANPDALAVARAGRMMPEGLEQQAARHEMLAPGTFMPAAASEEAAQAIGAGVGASPRASIASINLVRKKLAQITAAKEDVGASYDDIGNTAGPMKVDNDLRDLLHSVNERANGQTIGFDRLHKLRTYYREKGAAATHAEDQHTYAEFVAGVTEWLEHHVSGLSEIDSRFAFLAQSERNATKLLETLERGNMTHGKVNLFGGETGSVGGHLPAGARGLASSAFHSAVSRLTPGKSARAEAVARQLVAPADATHVASLARAYDASQLAREFHPYSNGVAPTGGTSAIMSLFNQLSNPLPEQMQAQDTNEQPLQ